MAITFASVLKDVRNIYRYDASDDAHSILGYSTSDYDIITTDTEEDDAIVFLFLNYNTGKSNKLQINVSENIVADEIDGVWEYYTVISTNVYSNTADNWKPLQNVEDSGNCFTQNQDGVVTISWDVPDDWDNYANPGGDSQWYSYAVRLRITNISGITNVGEITTTRCYGNNIEIIDEDVTFEDMYQEDLANGWNKITKNGKSDYVLNCGINMNSNSSLTSSEETITLINNHSIVNVGKCFFGVINEVGAPDKGTTIRFEGANADHSNCYLGRVGSKFLALTIQFPQEDRSLRQHGFWGGGIGSYADQEIQGGNFYNFRNYTFSSSDNYIKGLLYYNAHTEPAGAIIDGIKVIDSSYGIRPNQYSYGILVHRVDFTGATVANTNPYRVKDLEEWWTGYVDSIFNEDIPLSNYYQYDADDNQYVNNYKVVDFKSFIIALKDASTAAVSDVSTIILDKNYNSVLTLESNIDGYAALDKGSVSSSSDSIVEFNDFKDCSDSVLKYREILFTNGTAFNEKKIVKSSDESSFTIADSFKVQPEEDDRFIEVPYIAYRWQRPEEDQTSGYGHSPIEYQGDFTIRYRKYGYFFKSTIESFKNPVKNSITLFEDPSIIMSESDALEINNITITEETDPVSENDKLWSITLDCGNNNLEDVWHYLQAILSKTDMIKYHNILKRDGTSFIIDGGYYSNGADKIFKGVRAINVGDGVISKMQSDDGTYYIPPLIVKFSFTIDKDMTNYEYRIYKVDNKGSLKGAEELQGEESTSESSIIYEYEYVEDMTIAVQIIPHNNDYVESETYYTLSSSNQEVNINLLEDINN